MLQEWIRGAFLCVAALGPGLFSGREIAFFYAQTGKMGWLGILLCGALYGLFVFCTARFARKTGAVSFPQILRRKMGVYAGGGVWMLHVIALILWAWLMLRALGRCGALALPFRHGEWIGMAAGLVCAWALAGGRRISMFGFIMSVSAMLFLLILLLWGKLPQQARMYGHVDLRLSGSVKAALALSLLHGCRCMAVSASVAAGLAREVKAGRLGLSAGAWMILLLGTGKGIFAGQSEKLMALSDPFAAMWGEWGKAGYYFAAGMIWIGAMTGLASVVFSVKGLVRADGKNGC